MLCVCVRRGAILLRPALASPELPFCQQALRKRRWESRYHLGNQRVDCSPLSGPRVQYQCLVTRRGARLPCPVRSWILVGTQRYLQLPQVWVPFSLYLFKKNPDSNVFFLGPEGREGPMPGAPEVGLSPGIPWDTAAPLQRHRGNVKTGVLSFLVLDF